jgi:hypothetical protein
MIVFRKISSSGFYIRNEISVPLNKSYGNLLVWILGWIGMHQDTHFITMPYVENDPPWAGRGCSKDQDPGPSSDPRPA